MAYFRGSIISIVVFVCTTIIYASKPEFYTADSAKFVQWLYYTFTKDDNVKSKKNIERGKNKKNLINEKTGLPLYSCILLNDTILIPGDSVRGTIFLAPRVVRINKKPTIKKWIIGISADTFQSNASIKVFSGGELPPSTILWAGETSDGSTVNSGNYYCRMVLLDTKDQFEQTPWVKVEVRR